MNDTNAPLYDARGNRYVVVAPARIDGCPKTAAAAAAAPEWTTHAITACCTPCSNPEHDAAPNAAGSHEMHLSDGLIVGPFNDAPPYDICIVNTDGTLAERSGNGLTIFAAALADRGALAPGQSIDVRVHHRSATTDNPTVTTLTRADTPVADDMRAKAVGPAHGIWAEMGRPVFGPSAVNGDPTHLRPAGDRADIFSLRALAAIDPAWTRSTLVRLGNPHCVTWLPSPDRLPAFDALARAPLEPAARAIAFAGTTHDAVFPDGINLQWATVTAADRVAARIFERGEGPTASSGTSASAVASAARRLGLVTAAVVHVDMPGGTAIIRFTPAARTDISTAEQAAEFTVDYFGTARQVSRRA
ncbi:MAG: diaminopimelate epimerase [Pseudomonadota bacterium]